MSTCAFGTSVLADPSPAMDGPWRVETSAGQLTSHVIDTRPTGAPPGMASRFGQAPSGLMPCPG
jgi:hypothetical protein